MLLAWKIILFTIPLILFISTSEVDNNSNEIKLPTLPNPSSRPLIIQSHDHQQDDDDTYVYYRGHDRFCAGTVWGTANTSSHVWDPLKQESTQDYYFRYIIVNIRSCRWSCHGKHTTRIAHLFFTDPKLRQYARLSQPTRVSCHTFRFLLYVPKTVPTLDWEVRWTTCRCVRFSDCVKPHHEVGAFRPGQYIEWRPES